MSTQLTLTCPIRGLLKTGAKSKDGLKPTEEYYRVEAIKHLLKLGYPKEHFKIEAVVKRFGNGGRNSMRADLAVLDVPVTSISSKDVDEMLEHAVLLCEVKRENEDHEKVQTVQVRPLLDFAKLQSCIALYWDNVDQRIFWTETTKGKKEVKEAGLALLPKYGASVKIKPLTFADTAASDSLVDMFDRIEDLLHGAAIDPEARYSVILQLLLAKLFDEHGHVSFPAAALDIQDYGALGNTPAVALNYFNATLGKSVGYYERHLPKSVDKKLPAKVTGDILIEICKLFAPVRIIASKRDVIQVFYMKFAKGLYKWDLAQFFTPPTVTDFIVDVLNPQFGEHIKDPACGSADFLTAAFHKRRDIDKHYADCVWGTDNSKNAVQVAVLNMLLNGDGKSNIKEEDSLENVDKEKDKYEIMVCNPPFGVKITEKRPKVLRKFELGYEWKEKGAGFEKQDELLDSQETGLLFVETCVIQCKPGGRIGIILPNGYLGNRSRKYKCFRDWLLRSCKVVAIASFPRFTFKTSGADVSASVVYLEKREKPLKKASDDKSYSFTVQMIENVGWNLGDKKAAARYLRDQLDGSYIIGDDGNRMLDSDFASVLNDMRHSDSAGDFPWLVSGKTITGKSDGWSVSIEDVIKDSDITLDPKRHCKKLRSLRNAISKKPFFNMGDLVDFIPERTSAEGKRVKQSPKMLYKYIEIQDINWGDYNVTEMRGWELPDRAKHFCEPRDIYVGSIWGSVSKWCLMPVECGSLIVTSGCHRLRMKTGKEMHIVDLVSFFCSEAYAVQMRSFARGSDGLAEVTPEDTCKVLIPKLSDAERDKLKPYVDRLLAGTPDVKSKVLAMLSDRSIGYPPTSKRPSHVVLV